MFPVDYAQKLPKIVQRQGNISFLKSLWKLLTKRIDRIINATDKAGVLLGCIFQSRFAEGSKLVKQAVEQNRFGKLVLGDAYIKWFRSKEYYASASWRGTWKLDGGGALMNQGIHQIDLLLWFMGPVKRVFAQTQCIVHEGLEWKI